MFSVQVLKHLNRKHLLLIIKFYLFNMPEQVTSNQPPAAGNPQDFFLGAADVQAQKNLEKKQFFQGLWQKIQYYWSIVWPYVYNFVSFIIYEVVKVAKGIVHIAVSQIGQKD